MANYTGSLNANELYASIYNTIISQEVFADNLGKHQTIVDKARVDGGLYGDTKLYYATDVLHSYDFLPYAKGTARSGSASTLLDVIPPDNNPQCQSITINKFRQIGITLDNYLTKRAWMEMGAFSSFISIMTGWLTETRKVIDGTNYNVFLGTAVQAGIGGASPVTSKTWTLTSGKEGQEIAENLANLIVDMGDYSRDFNAYGFLRSYAAGDIKVIWNSTYVNKIKKIDLPTIFHNQGVVDKLDEDVMPARYFGTLAAVGDTPDGTMVEDASNVLKVKTGGHKVRFAEETTISTTHYFAGDEIPDGTVLGTCSAGKIATITVPYYINNSKVIGKVYVKLPPFMSAFETGTNFFNPQTLNENHYLTYGRNTLQLLDNYPWVSIEQA